MMQLNTPFVNLEIASSERTDAYIPSGRKGLPSTSVRLYLSNATRRATVPRVNVHAARPSSLPSARLRRANATVCGPSAIRSTGIATEAARGEISSGATVTVRPSFAL